MTTISTVEQLMELEPAPCEPARKWLAESGITELADAWDQCHRADWMLWLCDALDLLTDRERRLIVCRCVRETPLADGRRVWDLLTDERSRQAVEVAERHARGDATDEQLAVAWTAAWTAARTAADAAEAAARAAARDAAMAAADEQTATWAAARTATWAATAAAAATAARAEAWLAAAAARAAQADLVREIAGNPWRKEA
jgi:hypothetical protein